MKLLILLLITLYILEVISNKCDENDFRRYMSYYRKYTTPTRKKTKKKKRFFKKNK